MNLLGLLDDLKTRYAKLRWRKRTRARRHETRSFTPPQRGVYLKASFSVVSLLVFLVIVCVAVVIVACHGDNGLTPTAVDVELALASTA